MHYKEIKTLTIGKYPNRITIIGINNKEYNYECNGMKFSNMVEVVSEVELKFINDYYLDMRIDKILKIKENHV